MNKEEIVKIKEKMDAVCKIFEDSVRIVVASENPTATMLREKLRIEHPLSMSLIYMMEELGFISEENDEGERTILVSQEDIDQFFLKDERFANRKKINIEEVKKNVAKLGKMAELFEKSVKKIVELEHASASMLRRKFEIGYPLAMKIIDTMEEMGFISEAYNVGKRDIFITKDEVEEIFKK